MPSYLPHIILSPQPPFLSAWVENTATDFLDDSMFLRDGVDELGKTKNFAHPGLREATILFLYTGSYRIARRRPDIFRKEIPLTCLALVCTTVFSWYWRTTNLLILFFFSSIVSLMASLRTEMVSLSQSSLLRSTSPFIKQCSSFLTMSWTTPTMVQGWRNSFVHGPKLDGELALFTVFGTDKFHKDGVL